MSRADEWADPTPQPVTDLQIAFPAHVLDLMPPYDQDLRDWIKTSEADRWVRVQRDWFYSGLRDAKWKPRKGVDQAAAVRHLQAIQGSFEPRHEHKEAAVAWLLSRWFTNVKYAKGKDAA